MKTAFLSVTTAAIMVSAASGQSWSQQQLQKSADWQRTQMEVFAAQERLRRDLGLPPAIPSRAERKEVQYEGVQFRQKLSRIAPAALNALDQLEKLIAEYPLGAREARSKSAVYAFLDKEKRFSVVKEQEEAQQVALSQLEKDAAQQRPKFIKELLLLDPKEPDSAIRCQQLCNKYPGALYDKESGKAADMFMDQVSTYTFVRELGMLDPSDPQLQKKLKSLAKEYPKAGRDPITQQAVKDFNARQSAYQKWQSSVTSSRP